MLTLGINLVLGLSVTGHSHNKAFDRMLQSVTLSDDTLACVDEARTRTVLRGVSEVQSLGTVRRAFQVIYEDMPILRPAGDLAVRRLASTCAAARDRLETLHREDSGNLPDIQVARRYFDILDASGSGTLNLEELKTSCGASLEGAAALARACLDDECSIETSAGESSFADFVRLVSRSKLDLHQLASADTEECLLEFEKAASGTTPGQARLGAEYEELVATFCEWEQQVGGLAGAGAGKQGRLREILRGCFDGARNAVLSDALKVVYVDSATLRAGERG